MTSPSSTFPVYSSTPAGSDGASGADGGLHGCMITAQGELVCSRNKARRAAEMRRDLRGFGDQEDVDRLRQSLGLRDPYHLATVSRYVRAPRAGSAYERMVMRGADAPCCKSECKRVGGCTDVLDNVRRPTAPCVLCASNLCDGTC